MIASQPQMPSTLSEQYVPLAVVNASSAVETEAVEPTVSFQASESLHHFVSHPQQQLSCHDSLGSYIPISLKNKIWETSL